MRNVFEIIIKLNSIGLFFNNFLMGNVTNSDEESHNQQLVCDVSITYNDQY